MNPSNLLNHPAEIGILPEDLVRHFCPSNQNCNGNERECWNHFYENVSSDRVYNQNRYSTQDPGFPNPYVDTAVEKIRKLGANGWYKELETTINSVTDLRNPNNDLLKEINRDGNVYKISIGSTSGEEIDKMTQEVKKYLLDDYQKNIITPCFALRVFGFAKQNRWFHSHMVPHKIVISDAYSVYIEINIPTFQTEGGTVIHKLDYPTELNNLFNLFKPETGVAILLTHNQTYEVEAVISALMYLTNGNQVEFPGYVDVVSLWVYLGKYTVCTDLSYMYRLITGGTLIQFDEMEEPRTWMF